MSNNQLKVVISFYKLKIRFEVDDCTRKTIFILFITFIRVENNK